MHDDPHPRRPRRDLRRDQVQLRINQTRRQQRRNQKHVEQIDRPILLNHQRPIRRCPQQAQRIVHLRTRANVKHEESDVVADEKQTGNGLDDRILWRDRIAAVATFAFQEDPAKHRNVVEPREFVLALWAVRRRSHQRFAARQTPDDDIQKAADASTECEEKADEDDVLGGCQRDGLCSVVAWCLAHATFYSPSGDLLDNAIRHFLNRHIRHIDFMRTDFPIDRQSLGQKFLHLIEHSRRDA